MRVGYEVGLALLILGEDAGKRHGEKCQEKSGLDQLVHGNLVNDNQI